MDEKVVQIKTCKQCSTSFDITDKDLEFYEKVSPVFGGVKYNIPTPTLCPDCRQQRRLAFRNERNLYKRKCNLTEKSIISAYSSDKPYKVYEYTEWWSDKWDGLDYGIEFDFNKGFFEQFNSLFKEVPQINVMAGFNENCLYVNACGHSKNCYLIFDSDYCEESMYSNVIKHSTYLIDCSFCSSSNFLYGCIDCKDSYNLKYSFNCHNCSDSSFIKDCINCNNCFLSFNLVNKQYCILNKQYPKEEYSLKLKEILDSKNYVEIYSEFLGYINKKFLKENQNINTENCLGNYITNSKNTFYSYDVGEIEGGKYLDTLYSAKECHDVSSFGEMIEKVYYSGSIGVESQDVLFCQTVVNSSNIYYSTAIFNSRDCFGCIGLKNKQYCILNKQYTKEEYEDLVPKIIEHMKKTGEWGEFFSASISPFGYNETVAQEYFPIPHPSPLLKGEGIEGKMIKIKNPYASSPGGDDGGEVNYFNRSTYEAPFPKVKKIIPADKLPDNIKDIPDDILNWAIECEVTKKPFRIIAQELDFYRKHNLPIPRRHPDQRHLDRMSLRNPRKLYDKKCDKCEKYIKTTYSPEREEIVYCEECYNKEVY